MALFLKKSSRNDNAWGYSTRYTDLHFKYILVFVSGNNTLIYDNNKFFRDVNFQIYKNMLKLHQSTKRKIIFFVNKIKDLSKFFRVYPKYLRD